MKRECFKILTVPLRVMGIVVILSGITLPETILASQCSEWMKQLGLANLIAPKHVLVSSMLKHELKKPGKKIRVLAEFFPDLRKIVSDHTGPALGILIGDSDPAASHPLSLVYQNDMYAHFVKNQVGFQRESFNSSLRLVLNLFSHSAKILRPEYVDYAGVGEAIFEATTEEIQAVIDSDIPFLGFMRLDIPLK